MSKKIIAGAITNCVHVAGVFNFLRAAEQLGYETEFLGAAVSIDDFISAIKKHDPDIVGVSFRLTPDSAERILNEFKDRVEKEGLSHKRYAFGGTPPVCDVAAKIGLFERYFNGLENPQDVWCYLSGLEIDSCSSNTGNSFLDRIACINPYPILRHHFGLPDLSETLDGIELIAESKVLDVISLAPDQNAQESFFRPDEMDPLLDGAGGAPVRTEDDLIKMKNKSRTGNYPLLRIYSGTRDLLKWAELSHRTIDNAWGAIPLCWYNALDGRSSRPPIDSIAENKEVMKWYAEHDLPLEVNEAHHWSLREAHDTIAVVSAYLAAYNAKSVGVKNYIAQYMFNTPPMAGGAMDLAKMLAKIELIESLHDDSFKSYRQARAGLLHMSPRMNLAKGQLAASTMLAMQIKPSIIHVVGFCEGDHAARADEVIESCEIVQGAIKNSIDCMPDMFADTIVLKRKEHLLNEANILINEIRKIDTRCDDPLASPKVISEAIRLGMLDAPQLKGNKYAAGRLHTGLVNGGIDAIDTLTKKSLSEEERLNIIGCAQRL